MRLIHFGGFFWENVEKYGKTFFRAVEAGLGKYCTGYGRIGVYRDYNAD